MAVLDQPEWKEPPAKGSGRPTFDKKDDRSAFLEALSKNKGQWALYAFETLGNRSLINKHVHRVKYRAYALGYFVEVATRMTDERLEVYVRVV